MKSTLASFTRQFKIYSSHSQRGYDIQADDGKWLHAEMEFQELTPHKLTLSDRGEDSAPVAVSHMPWVSRRLIHVDFAGSDKTKEMDWENMEKVKKLPWEDHSRDEYRWSTLLPEQEAALQLMWISRDTEGIQPWGMGSRIYTLVDTQSNEIVAECVRNGNLYAGGVLEFNKSWRRGRRTGSESAHDIFGHILRRATERRLHDIKRLITKNRARGRMLRHNECWIVINLLCVREKERHLS